jgi:hypothetical protein
MVFIGAEDPAEEIVSADWRVNAVSIPAYLARIKSSSSCLFLNLGIFLSLVCASVIQHGAVAYVVIVSAIPF